MRYVIRDGELIERHKAPRLPVQRSSLPAPYIRSDGMSDTRNPVDGRLYDSKSQFERAVRDAGCTIVGDDPAFSELKPREHIPAPGLEQDIKDACEQLGVV